MKKVLIFVYMAFLIVLGTANMDAQVQIGGNTGPKKGVVLDLNSAYKGGLLLPHVEITDMGKIPATFSDASAINNLDVASDLIGLIVWNTYVGNGIIEGIYVWDGDDWNYVMAGGTTPITPCAALDAPGSITFDKDSIERGFTVTATCGPVPNATSYVWTLPPSMAAQSTTTTVPTLLITGSIAGEDIIQVRATNACGEISAATDSDPFRVMEHIVIFGVTEVCDLTKLPNGYEKNRYEYCPCTEGGSPVAWQLATERQRAAATSLFLSEGGPSYQVWFFNNMAGVTHTPAVWYDPVAAAWQTTPSVSQGVYVCF